MPVPASSFLPSVSSTKGNFIVMAIFENEVAAPNRIIFLIADRLPRAYAITPCPKEVS